MADKVNSTEASHQSFRPPLIVQLNELVHQPLFQRSLQGPQRTGHKLDPRRLLPPHLLPIRPASRRIQPRRPREWSRALVHVSTPKFTNQRTRIRIRSFHVRPCTLRIPSTHGISSANTLLPTHHSDPLHTPSYPPLDITWNRFRAWLAREYPELGDTLNYGILPQDLALVEEQFGFELPRVVRESYLAVDGQEAESAAGCSEGLFFGMTLLPLDDVLEEWRFWREVDDDPSTGANPHLREEMRSVPTGWVRKAYSQRGWLPLIADKAGNYVGVDLNPDEGGSIGQVIVFGRDFDTKVVLWGGDGAAGWAKWLSFFVDDLESGDGYEIGGNDNSDEAEDDIGYESYFYDGTGRGQGDGGGDNGAGGGLRLAGEYRGWNVFEAWADRSLSKWFEMGLVTEPLEPPVEKVEEATLGVVLPPEGEVQNIVTDEAKSPKTPVSATAAAQPVPMINVTKAPAPLPVDLPTESDIEVPPSPSDSPRGSFHDDLEAGLGIGMREVQHDSTFARAQTNVTPVVTSVPISSSPPPTAQIPDLLADSAPLLQTDTIIAPSIPEPEPVVVVQEPQVEETAPPVIPASEQPEDEDAVDADTTIRLVGGGGISGLSLTEEPEETPAEGGEVDTDAESVADSVTSQSSVTPSGDASASTTKKKSKHKKTMSGLAGLKKLVGKKDSTASIKDAAAATSA
ncbi:hypothetical protein MKEN_01054800 [Mycena kentingensis (nom. inval.)]|nr:hypothetical protein MKEN_01054800 [Mycena kentingensis (nom. inval.)]